MGIFRIWLLYINIYSSIKEEEIFKVNRLWKVICSNSSLQTCKKPIKEAQEWFECNLLTQKGPHC